MLATNHRAKEKPLSDLAVVCLFCLAGLLITLLTLITEGESLGWLVAQLE